MIQCGFPGTERCHFITGRSRRLSCKSFTHDWRRRSRRRNSVTMLSTPCRDCVSSSLLPSTPGSKVLFIHHRYIVVGIIVWTLNFSLINRVIIIICTNIIETIYNWHFISQNLGELKCDIKADTASSTSQTNSYLASLSNLLLALTLNYSHDYFFPLVLEMQVATRTPQKYFEAAFVTWWAVPGAELCCAKGNITSPGPAVELHSRVRRSVKQPCCRSAPLSGGLHDAHDATVELIELSLWCGVIKKAEIVIMI